MTLLLALSIGANVLTVAGFLRYVSSRDRREEKLLDRIQAPEVAVHQSTTEGRTSPPAVTWDSDEDYWAAVEARR